MVIGVKIGQKRSPEFIPVALFRLDLLTFARGAFCLSQYRPKPYRKSRHHADSDSAGSGTLYLVEATIRLVNGFLLSYGPQSIKRRMWEKQYRGPKWLFRDNTSGDRIYAHLETHARKGRILDLGCGSGNTAAELADPAYESYVGVDISEVALEKARKRTQECGREGKNRFVRGDFLAWQPAPAEQFDVILFRESMYFVPMQKIKDILDRYSKYLRAGGVFVVGLYVADKKTARDKSRPSAMVRIMEKEFDVVEKREFDHKARPTVLVLRPRQQPQIEKTG